MVQMYLLTFDRHLHVHFQNYNGTQNSLFYSISIWGKKTELRLLSALQTKNISLFSKHANKCLYA